MSAVVKEPYRGTLLVDSFEICPHFPLPIHILEPSIPPVNECFSLNFYFLIPYMPSHSLLVASFTRVAYLLRKSNIHFLSQIIPNIDFSRNIISNVSIGIVIITKHFEDGIVKSFPKQSYNVDCIAMGFVQINT